MAKNTPKFVDYILGYEDFAKNITPSLGKVNPIKKIIGDSVKEALTVTVKEPSKKPTTIPYEFLDDPGELDSLSPSQVSVSLNIGDLITNPIKTTKDFVTKSYKSVTNVGGDIDNVIAQEKIWRPLAQGKKPGSEPDSNILEKVVGAGMYQTVKYLDPTLAADGVGFSEDIAGDLRDYTKKETAYQMGHGDIEIASNPAEKFVETFANGMSSLSSTSKREDSFTNISLGLVDILDAQVTRDHQHDLSYILGSEVSEILNSRVGTYVDTGIDPRLNPAYKQQNTTKIVDHFGNSALIQSLNTVQKAQETLISEKEIFRNLNSQSTALETELYAPTTSLQRKAEIRQEQIAISEQLKVQDQVVINAQKQFNRSSYELIGDGTAGSTGLLQNISAIPAVAALDPSNADHQKVIEAVETYSRAASNPNNFYNALQNGSLQTQTEELVNIYTEAAIENADPELIFRSQNKAIQGLNTFSKSINDSFSKSYDKKKPDSTFSAQDLVSNKDQKIIAKLEFKIQNETDAAKKSELQSQLAIVKDKSERGVEILVGNTRDKVSSELDNIQNLRSKLRGSEKATKEFDSIFGKHVKELKKMQETLDSKEFDRKSIYTLLKKQNSVYSTDTIGGGIKDSTTRKFMDTLFYKKDSELAKVFKESVDPDTYKRAKIMHRLTRNNYESELAGEAIKIFDKGPEGLISELTQRYIKERIGLAFNADLTIKNVLKETILKPLAYGGLFASDDLDAELGDAPGLKGFIYRKIGKKLSQRVGKNIFSINVDGSKIDLVGGAHFAGAVSLGNLINSGRLSEAQITSLLNAKDIKSVEGILKGLIFKKSEKQGLEKDIKDIGIFRDWLKNSEEGKKAAKFLGITYNKKGEIVMTKKLNGFFKSLAARANNSSLIGPTIAIAGSLAKISQFLSVVQGKFKVIMMAIKKPLELIKQVVVQALTSFITGFVAGVTGGLGLILRVFIQAVVQKAVDIGSKLLGGIFKGNMDDFTDAIEETFKTFAKWVGLIMLPSIILFNMLTDITPFISSIPSDKVTRYPVSTKVEAAGEYAPRQSCKPIEDRGALAGSCAISECASADSLDWSPYDNGVEAFTEGFATVLDAAAADFNIPAAVLAAIIYSEGWSENYDGKFDEEWTRDNVCEWSVPEGETIPDCRARANEATGASGPLGFIPEWFEPYVERINDKTPIPRNNYTHCNLLDSTYAAAAAIADLAAAAGITGCDDSWFEPMGSQPNGYNDGLDLSVAPKIQWVTLHYSCGTGTVPGFNQCFEDTWLTEYSVKSSQVFEALFCEGEITDEIEGPQYYLSPAQYDSNLVRNLQDQVPNLAELFNDADDSNSNISISLRNLGISNPKRYMQYQVRQFNGSSVDRLLRKRSGSICTTPFYQPNEFIERLQVGVGCSQIETDNNNLSKTLWEEEYVQSYCYAMLNSMFQADSDFITSLGGSTSNTELDDFAELFFNRNGRSFCELIQGYTMLVDNNGDLRDRDIGFTYDISILGNSFGDNIIGAMNSLRNNVTTRVSIDVPSNNYEFYKLLISKESLNELNEEFKSNCLGNSIMEIIGLTRGDNRVISPNIKSCRTNNTIN